MTANPAADSTAYSTYDDVLEGRCPFGGNTVGGAQATPPTLSDWYPDRLRVEQLHRDGPAADPLADLDHPAAFATIDLAELKADITRLLTTSVSWWPSDYGNYAPQMIRMAWHSAGTEGAGLTPASVAAADSVVRIPMHGGVDSLNVAAASAVAFWALGSDGTAPRAGRAGSAGQRVPAPGV